VEGAPSYFVLKILGLWIQTGGNRSTKGCGELKLHSLVAIVADLKWQSLVLKAYQIPHDGWVYLVVRVSHGPTASVSRAG